MKSSHTTTRESLCDNEDPAQTKISKENAFPISKYWTEKYQLKKISQKKDQNEKFRKTEEKL